MKILFINKFLYARGGAETYMLRLGQHLADLGHTVEYFGMQDGQNTVGNSMELYTGNMDFHTSRAIRLLYPFRIIYSFEARKKLRKLLRQMQPDIVHLNNVNYQLTPSVIDECAKQGVPMVETVHDYQLLCPNHMMFDLQRNEPCERCVRGSFWNCAKNRCIHGSQAKSVIGTFEALLYQYRKTYEKVGLYITPSHFMEQKLQQKSLFRGKTYAIHNFVEGTEPSPAAAKEDYVLYFGRLSTEKGLHLFAESCRQLPDIRFVIAGSGPLENLFLDIPNVEFVGFQTGQALQNLIAKALFSVYPSIWYENCPLSVLESQSLGTPVLGSRMGGIPELIEHGETGWLLEELTVGRMVESIRFLYGDKALLERMSESCLQKSRHMITLPAYAQMMLECYQQQTG